MKQEQGAVISRPKEITKQQLAENDKYLEHLRREIREAIWRKEQMGRCQ